MAEEFLGISAHFDVSEVLTNFTELINKLEEAGKVASETCDQMTSALTTIQSHLSGELSADGLDELNASLDTMKTKVQEAMEGFVNGTSNMKWSEVTQMVMDYQSIIEAVYSKTQEAHQKEADNVSRLTQELEKLKEERQKAISANATNDEISEYNSKINALTLQLNEAEKQEKAFEETLKQANTALAEANTVVDGITEKAPTLGEAWHGVGEALVNAKDGFKDWITGSGKAQEAVGQFKEGLSELPGPLGGAVSGFKKMWSAVKLFMATPIGRVLGVIVFLLQAFKTWTSKSAEGQRFLAKATAYVGSILESLTDILVKVGGYLFHAFADATGPMNAFANGLVTTLKHAVKAASALLGGLGDILRGVGKMFKGDFEEGWETIKSGASSVGKAFEEAGQGFVSAIGTAFNGIKGIVSMAGDGLSSVWNGNLLSVASSFHNKAMAAADAAEEQSDAEENITANKMTQAALEDRIADAKGRAANASKEELKTTIADLRALTTEKYEDMIQTQEKQLDLLKKRNSLHTKGLKDIMAEQVMELQLWNLEQKRSAALRAISKIEEKREKQLDNQEKREKKAQERAEKAAERKEKREKAAAAREAKRQAREAVREQKKNYADDKAVSALGETIYKNTAERVKEQAEIEDELTKARIAAMKDGAEKVRAQREYEHKKELRDLAEQAQKRIDAEIKRQKEEYEKTQAALPLKDRKAWNRARDLDNAPIEELMRQYQELADLRTKAWDIEEEKELTGKYQSYYDKRIEIERQFDDEIERLWALRSKAQHDNDQEEVAKLTRSIAKAQAEKGKALVSNALSQIKESPSFKKAFEDIGSASQSTLKALVGELARAASKAKRAGYDISELQKEIEKIQKQMLKDAPFVAMQKAADDAKRAHEELEKARMVLDAVNNGAQIIKEWKVNDDGTLTAVYLSQADAQKVVAEANNKFIRSQEKAYDAAKSAISVIDKLRSSFQDLGKAIGGTVGDIVGMVGSVAGFASEGLKGAMDSAKAAEAAEAANDKMGAALSKANMWLAAMSAMVKIIGAVQNLLPTSDSLYEKYAAKQQEINNLRRAVEEYQLAVLQAQQAEKGWFGKSGLTSLTDAYEKHGKVVDAYYAKLYEAQEKYHNKSAGLSKALPYIAALAAVAASVVTFGAGAIAGAGLLGATLTASLGTAAGAATAAAAGAVAGIAVSAVQAAVDGITYKNGQVAAKDNLRMKTRHKTWFRGEKTQDLSEWAREQLGAELFDNEGLINLEAAQTILERYGDKLVGETKETLEDLVKLRKEYDEFMEQVEKYVTDLYSPLVDDMTDALFNWLETGTDVLYQFRQNAKDTFAAIAKDMVKQMLLTQVFDQYKEDLKKIYASYAATKNRDTLINGVMLATDSFLAKAESEIPVIQEALTKINDQFAERGFDLTKSSDEGSGAYSAAKSFSQEQGDELNGRLTAIQIGQQQGIMQRSQLIELQSLTFGAVVQLGGSLLSTSKDISAMRDMQYAGLQRLAEISVFTSVLPNMAENINDMRNDIRTKL